MTRKFVRTPNSSRYIYRVMGDMMYESSNYTVVTVRDKKRIEAQHLVNNWDGIDTNNIDKYIEQINTLYTVTIRILRNIEYVKDQDSMLSFMQGKFVNINKTIESYNDYRHVNPFVAIKYPHLDPIDLKGVVLVD